MPGALENAACTVTADWGDGNYTFCLNLGQLEELKEKTGCGPEELMSRLMVLPSDQGGIAASIRHGLLRPGPNDIREIVRLGLIGGGMEPVKALALVLRYVDARPRAENYAPAFIILSAVINGCPDDLAKKSDAPQDETETEKTAAPGSTSAQFTPQQ